MASTGERWVAWVAANQARARQRRRANRPLTRAQRILAAICSVAYGAAIGIWLIGGGDAWLTSPLFGIFLGASAIGWLIYRRRARRSASA